MYKDILIVCGIFLADNDFSVQFLVPLSSMNDENWFSSFMLDNGDSAQGTTVDKCSNNNTIAHAQKCLDLNQVPMTLPAAMSGSPSPLSLFTFTFQINVTTENVICRREHRENYTQASLCMFSKMRECAKPKNPLILYLIPTPDNVRKLTQQMCEGTEDYNQTCAINTFNAMRICVVTIASERAVDFSQLSCENIEILRECTRQKLQPCGDATAQMHETNLPVLERCISTTAVYAQDAAEVNLAVLVNCSESKSMLSGMQKCLGLYDVPINLPDPELLSNSSTSSGELPSFLSQIDRNTTANLCRPANRENYIKGSLCIYYIVKKCAGDSQFLQSLIPSPQKVRQQVQFQCQTIEGFNQSCVISKIQEIQNCVNVSQIVTGLLGTNSTDDDFERRLSCVTYDLTRVCARKHLKSCGASTVQLYEQNLPVLDFCKNYTDTNQGTDGEKTVDCSSTFGVRKSYLTCQVNAGIFLQLPEMDTSNELSEYILKSVTLENRQLMCRNLSEYSELINCTLSVKRECSPDSLKSTVPDTQSVLTGFPKLCKNIDGFDAQCVLNVTESACKERKRRSVSNKTIPKHMCKDTIDHNTCLLDSVKSCGDVTSSQYADILSAQLPQMCLEKTTTDTTVTDNAAFRLTVSALLVIVSAIILH